MVQFPQSVNKSKTLHRSQSYHVIALRTYTQLLYIQQLVNLIYSPEYCDITKINSKINEDVLVKMKICKVRMEMKITCNFIFLKKKALYNRMMKFQNKSGLTRGTILKKSVKEHNFVLWLPKKTHPLDIGQI